MSGRRPAKRGGKTRSPGASGRRSGGGRPQDHFGERARKQGYPSRAVYKLEEIDQRTRLFRRGQRVLDLGAAPGSWTVYASEQVGDEGRVLGVDLQEIKIAAPSNARFEQLDLRELSDEKRTDVGQFDIVLSDMAPRTSGMRHRDQYLSYELFSLALELTDRLLADGGSFVGKIFQGEDFPEARRATAARFEHVRIFKPEASRSESYEVFLVGLGRRPRGPAGHTEPER